VLCEVATGAIIGLTLQSSGALSVSISSLTTTRQDCPSLAKALSLARRPSPRTSIRSCLYRTTRSTRYTPSSTSLHSPATGFDMSTERIPPPPKWVVELSSPPPSRSKIAGSLPDPPGYFSSKTVSKKTEKNARRPPTQQEMDTLKLKKSWEIALGPAKQLPMQAIMGYMSGNGLQIFSIMMVFML